MKKGLLAVAAFGMMLMSCGQKKETQTVSGLLPSKFETYTKDGQTTGLYVMKNTNGMEVCVTNIGGRIVSIMVPDKNGEMKDVVLGFDNVEDYMPISTNFGALIGRYGNRIAKGKFQLDRVNYQLRTNNGENTLHGGPRGFHTQYWNIEQNSDQQLTLKYMSKHNEEGFPGDMRVTVTYTLTNDNALELEYEAETNRPTIINLTNHSYFNLSGDPNNTILDHVLFIDAATFTPTDSELIPTGKIEKVAKTPFDFTTPTAIGDRIDNTSDINIQYGGGYDHNYVYNKPGDLTNMATKVYCPASGITMEVYTDQPGVQFYAGNFLDGTNVGKKGIVYQKRSALCLETQHFPDSPNQPSFPSTVLRPEEMYYTKTVYKFGVEK